MDPQDLDLTELQLREARGGDASSLEALFERYLPRVRRLVACRLGKTLEEFVDAEDVVQQTFLDIIASFDGPERSTNGPFANWIARVVENNLRDEARRRDALKRGAGQVRRLADLGETHLTDSIFTGDHPSPSQIVGAGEAEERLERALLRLRDRYREVINLRVNGGLSYREIAEVMDLPSEDTANSLFLRARNKLAAELGG